MVGSNVKAIAKSFSAPDFLVLEMVLRNKKIRQKTELLPDFFILK